MGIQSGARRQHSILNPFWKQKTPTTMLGARQLGAIVAAGLAALLGANIFAGTTSEAILDDSPSQRNHKIGSFLTGDHLDTFKSDGIVVVDGLLSESELKEVSSELITRMEKHVAEGVAVDDALINHHLTDPYIFNLTKHPNFLAAASQILESPRLRLFSSRLLCKLPGTEEDPNSREVPWHQDSQYWPLEPMKEATLGLLWMMLLQRMERWICSPSMLCLSPGDKTCQNCSWLRRSPQNSSSRWTQKPWKHCPRKRQLRWN